MLTKECQHNFIICFTGVVNATKIDALGAIKTMDIPTDYYLYFENDCLLPLPLELIPNYDEDYEEMAKMYWNRNKKNFKKLIGMNHGLIMNPMTTGLIRMLHQTR